MHVTILLLQYSSTSIRMGFFFLVGVGTWGASVSVSRSEICAERRSLLLPIQTNDMGLISAVVCVWRYCYDKQAGRHGSRFPASEASVSMDRSFTCFGGKQSIFCLDWSFCFSFPFFFPSSLRGVLGYDSCFSFLYGPAEEQRELVFLNGPNGLGIARHKGPRRHVTLGIAHVQSLAHDVSTAQIWTGFCVWRADGTAAGTVMCVRETHSIKKKT